MARPHCPTRTMRFSPRLSPLALAALVSLLSACSALESNKVEYKSASKAPSLEVPPDLTQLSKDTRYQLPGQAVSASAQAQVQAAPSGVPTAATQVGDVRIERAGNQRWLVIDRSPEALWDPVKTFWHDNGFVLAIEKRDLGIQETDWAENRAKIPQDFIRNALGKLLDSLYSTGERDKFRTRLERNAAGGTDLFISHKGMIEVFGDRNKDTTVWTPRSTDPELEAEFLRRLMVKLGVADTQAKALLTSAPAAPAAHVGMVDGHPGVELSDPFDRAWRRVGLALDRSNFTVEDRDRSAGVYFVRYVAVQPDQADPGFFARLFSSKKAEPTPRTYRVTVTSATSGSRVSIAPSGAPEAAATGDDLTRIAQVLADALN